MSLDLIKNINDADFEQEVLQTKNVVMVDFWAPWCAPCKAIAPILDAIAIEFKDQLQIVKINVDDNKQSPARYTIRGIPSLLLFKDGELLETIIGNVSKEKIVTSLEKYLT